MPFSKPCQKASPPNLADHDYHDTNMNTAEVSILATYAFQIILICFFPVPSAGSTAEMLFKLGKDRKLSLNHPAKSAIQSPLKIIVMIIATITVLLTALIPLITILFPPAAAHLFPFMKAQSNFLTFTSALLIIGGNILRVARDVLA